LLGTVCSGKGFEDKDFFDSEKPIEVELEIKLLTSEQGFFGDNFIPDDSSCIKIRYRQTIEEAYPTIVSANSKERIQIKQIRKINFLRYDTTSVPSKELRLDTQKGAGFFINGIIGKYISNSQGVPDFLNNGQVSKLTDFINEYLGRIRSFKDYGIKAMIAPKPGDMLTSLFYLSDGERKIDTTGSGVQYMAMASINILCQIMELYRSKAAPFAEQLYKDDNGKTILPLVLSIDEPEVHLHPYLQRSLIGYYKRILHNEDTAFTELLKMCFEIDGIAGQLIIVTHSTDALVGDYRNLIRFYKKENSTEVISGYDLTPKKDAANDGCIKSEDEKQLIMHFPEIKEAFYAKCAILIEGETEYGCINAFAEKIGISLDDYGICVINAHGESSIKPLCQLLDAFAIPTISIYDGDVRGKYDNFPTRFFTNELCFEIEVVKTLYDAGRQDIVKDIALELDSKITTAPLDFDLVSKPFKKMGVELYSETKCESCGHTVKIKDASSYTPKLLFDVGDGDREEFCRMYSAWFMAKKSVLLGRIIGEKLSAATIPTCYTDAIKKAQEVASNV